MGNGVVKSVGGKPPEKYFKLEVWPNISDLFEKLHLDESKCYQLFLAFCLMDPEEKRITNVNKCFQYLGGIRTKFTERVYYYENLESKDNSLNFMAFSLASWNYCTLQPSGLARMIFEIFDPDNKLFVTRAQVQTMYRMLYDCDTHDEKVIKSFPFDDDNTISKSIFINHCNRHRHLIKPAIDYQTRLKKMLGGIIMWESVISCRKSYFQAFEVQYATLDEVLIAIVKSEDMYKKMKKQEADRVLLEQRLKLRQEAEEAQKKLKQRERELEEERRKQEKNSPEKIVRDIWYKYEIAREDFDLTKYTIDEMWNRREARMELFRLFDEAKEKTIKFYSEKDDNDMKLLVGTDEDHEARYQDYILTDEGRRVYQRTMLYYLFKKLTDQIEEKYVKKGRPNDRDKWSERELRIANTYLDIDLYRQSLNKPLTLSIDDSYSHPLSTKSVKPLRSFDNEMLLAKKNGRKIDFNEADKLAHDELFEWHRNKVIRELSNQQILERKVREKEFMTREFDIVMNCGSKITNWEYLYDKIKERYFYINVNTLEIIHAKTAICEICDSIYEQFDLRCKTCNSQRSSKNMLYYRPLGSKDIRTG